jgi:23S rRNA (cytosine1962-C5)-methyltransferase
MITLKKNADRRVRRGHLWVFSNEIAKPPVSEIEPGSVHDLCDTAGEFIGTVYANSSSLIAARILSRKKIAIDQDFFRVRIEEALELRKGFCADRDAYRVIFSESDFVPGLIVDRYGPYLVVQSLTAGIDRHIEEIAEALQETISPEGIYLRSDAPFRSLEGLPEEKRVLRGTVPEEVTFMSSDLKMLVDIPNGQKTGFFLDQEANRSLVRTYLPSGARVLDLFCYTGAWGIHAVAAGASEVVAVDTSRSALAQATATADLNGLADRFYPVRDSAVDFLKKNTSPWDAIVIDPPAFIKSRSLLKEGIKGYIDVNRRAIGRLRSGGILITCSCSHHLSYQDFESLLHSAARQAGKELRIIDTRGQGPDHPVLLAMPETRYLKVIVAHAL